MPLTTQFLRHNPINFYLHKTKKNVMFRFLILGFFAVFWMSCSTSQKSVIPPPAIHPKRLAVLIAYDYNVKSMANIASGIADVLEQHQKLKKADIIFFSMSIENADFDLSQKKMDNELAAAFFNPDAVLFLALTEGLSERQLIVPYMLDFEPSGKLREGKERFKRSDNPQKDGQKLAFMLSSKLSLE